MRTSPRPGKFPGTATAPGRVPNRRPADPCKLKPRSKRSRLRATSPRFTSEFPATVGDRGRPGLIDRWGDRAGAQIDIAPLVWFRVAFGLIMLVEVWRFFDHAWIGRYYVEPEFLFKYYGFEWVQPWSGSAAMHLHFAVLGVLAVCITLGWFYRIVTIAFFVGFTYVFLLEQARYLNHLYLVCLFSWLMIFVPAHRSCSIDARRDRRLRCDTAPAWSRWLLRAQIGVVYFFGGVAKLNADWLQGEPLRTWLARRSDYPVVGEWLTTEPVVYLFSYGGLLFDLGIVPLLLWRKTRRLAFVLAAVFNLINAWIFQIGIFPWLALGATIILFAGRCPRPFPHAWRFGNCVPQPSRSARRLTLALVAAYLVFQFAVPLRHWLYPGNVHWTEEGHRFAWRMKLRDKAARMTLYAHDPDSAQTWRVDPGRYINAMQRRSVAGRPDMILQLCHHVAGDFRRRGMPRIQVRAHVQASLNGRPEHPLVDPDVDLAAEPRTLGPAHWITRPEFPLWRGDHAADAQGLEDTDSS